LRNISFVIFVFLLLISCTGEISSYEFESYKWKKNTVVELNFNEDGEIKDDLILEIRSIYGLTHANLSLDFNLLKPDGTTLSFIKELSFDSGKMDCAGDFCDQRVTILKDFKFTKGSYKLTILPRNNSNDLYGLIEFRLIQK
jgi:hypothetical protein